jgi:S1-C subfamily serine protease
MSSVLMQLNNEMAGLVEKVRQSLVQVTDGQGGAAGSIWHSQGLIVTNAHIISHKHARVTLFDGRDLGAKVLACDKDKDLAALSIDAEGLPTIALGDSTRLNAGQFVVAMGHPWGVNGLATAGIIMGAGAEHLRISYARNLLAVNLPLRPGNSGGPLVDAGGRLVGINTMMTGPDTGLAIPVNLAKAFLKDRLGCFLATK